MPGAFHGEKARVPPMARAATARPENTSVRRDMGRPSVAENRSKDRPDAARGERPESVMKMTFEHCCFSRQINVCARGRTALYAALNFAMFTKRKYLDAAIFLPSPAPK